MGRLTKHKRPNDPGLVGKNIRNFEFESKGVHNKINSWRPGKRVHIFDDYVMFNVYFKYI